MLTKGAIGNLINRYRAVLKKCHLINVFGSMPTPQNTWGEKRSHRWACTALLASVLLGGMLSTGYAAAINANVNENIGEALKNASDFSNAPFVVKNEHSYANEYTVELGNDLNFTTKIDLNKYGTPNWGDLDSSLGLINILSWNSKFDISGQQDSKEKPLITITHLPDDNGNLPTFTGDEQGSSNAPTNYAIVARGNSDRKYNTSLNFTNVNLNLNVVNGINAYMFGAVTVANSDCVTINAKKGDAFKRAISTVHSGNINIDSQNIHINVSGKNKNKDGEQFYYNTGLNTIDGGTIDLHATEELNIGVTTKNKINDIKVMNVGVHSYGNVDETDKIETYDNSNIILSGKSLGINVTRPDDSGYARAMWSVATNKNATISAEFDNIEIMSDNEGLATSITKENNNAVSSKIDLKATSGDIEITANSKAIYADIHSGISGVSLNAYNGSISLKSDGYAIENAVSDSTESSTIELKANEISILGNASKAIFSNVDENASRATASINIDGSNKLEIQTRNGSGLVAHGTGDGTINLNSNNGGTTILAGHLVSESDSKTNIGLNTNQSKWTGFAQDYRGVTDGAHKKGEINITAKDNATWYVKPVSGSYANGQDTKSYLTRWNSQESRTLICAKSPSIRPSISGL